MRTRFGMIGWSVVIGVMLSARAFGQAPPTPPAQPASGPGGSTYAHAAVTINGPYWAEGHAGDNAYRYFLYEPAQPAPAVAPVVLFLHGWLALEPFEYHEWMVHIARKGYTVVWAQYDTLNLPWSFATAASVTWKDALKRLDAVGAQPHVRPERYPGGGMKTAIVGHSAGGYVAAHLAVRATRWWNGIPKPAAVAAFAPGGGSGLIPGDDFTKIDPATKLLLVAGEDDDIVCTDTATKLWNWTPQIPVQIKDYLIVRSDRRGEPLQLSTHYYPTTSGTWDTDDIDARDFYVTWKLSVAMLNCTFRGQNCADALGNGAPGQIDMGLCSDGVPLNKILWVADPNAMPRTAVCVGKRGA